MRFVRVTQAANERPIFVGGWLQFDRSAFLIRSEEKGVFADAEFMDIGMEKILLTDDLEQTAQLFGSLDCHAIRIEQEYGVSVRNRDSLSAGGSAVVLSGGTEENRYKAFGVFTYLKRMQRLNRCVTDQNVEYAISMMNEGKEEELQTLEGDCICVNLRGTPIKAKTVGQQRYVDLICSNTVVLGVGPAGTGKTYLAVAMAVKALRAKEVSRIVLTRPAVEAGEKLGYLPGDLQNKVDPYLRPLYDGLYDMLGAESFQKNLERGVIEIAPLAYMRGRTLDDSFIILDEAQNTTPEQMKMFLTRLGFRAKAVVTGDITQTDLPAGKTSGLVEAMHILKGIEGIAIHRFGEKDVVRHRLVQQIILAYQKYGEKGGAR